MDSGEVLDPAKTYNVYAVCWSRQGRRRSIGTRMPVWTAGRYGCVTVFRNMTICSIPVNSVIDGCQLFLGQVSGLSSVLVNVGGPASNTESSRAWFDGIAFKETTPGPFVTLDISAILSDPASVAQNSLDENALNISPPVGLNSIVQGTRIRVTADEVGLNCPDIYDFTGFTGDITSSSNFIDLKMDQAFTLTGNYEVRVYTPECGDLCHPKFQGDTNDDCLVDLVDFMNISMNWLKCTKPECD